MLRLLPCLLAALALSACAPHPVYRLSADDADVSYWDAGRAYLYAHADSVAAEVSYELTTDEGHVFDIGFANWGDAPVVVDPADLSVATLGEADIPVGEPLGALDPEAVMLDLDLAASAREASNRTNRLVEGIGAGVSLVATSAAVAAAEEEGEASEAVVRYAIEESARVGRVAYEEQAHRVDQEVIASDRDWWANAALRRSTLLPGQTVRGWVLVPLDPDARHVELFVPLGATTARFRFEQSRFVPD